MTCRDPSEEKIVENFLKEVGIEESKKIKILSIIKAMGKSHLGESHLGGICLRLFNSFLISFRTFRLVLQGMSVIPQKLW